MRSMETVRRRRAAFSVCVSLPTLDTALAQRIDGRTARATLARGPASADAGIRMRIAIAPVLPHLTDDRATLEDVRRGAAETGASFAWHGVLNLGDVARDAFFGYRAADQPQLVDVYRAMYPAKYPPAAYVRRIDERAAVARSRIPLTAPATIVPEAPRELTLF
jgi:DNA repair photolyase